MKGKYPIRDEYGNMIWKNLFKMDKMSIVFLIIIVVLLVAFKHDTAKCEEVYEKPYSFCGVYCERNCDNCVFESDLNMANYSIEIID